MQLVLFLMCSIFPSAQIFMVVWFTIPITNHICSGEDKESFVCFCVFLITDESVRRSPTTYDVFEGIDDFLSFFIPKILYTYESIPQ